MAFKALWIPNTSYLPGDDRHGMSALLTPASADYTGFLTTRSGVLPHAVNPAGGSGPLQVVPGGALSVNVSIGHLVLAAGTNKGAYLVTNDSAYNIALATADVTNSRIDLIYALVEDTSNGGATDAVTIDKVTGTPAGSPVAPSLPAGAYEVGRVTVTAGLATVATGNITDSRTFTAPLGAALLLPSASKPSHPTVAQPIWETDTHAHRRFDGLAWRRAGFADDVTYANRPTRATPGDRIIDPTTGVEWVYRKIGGVGYWTPPNGTGVGAFRSSSGPSVTNATYTPLTWNTEDLDLLDAHSTVSNTSRYTPLIPGWYEFSGGFSFENNITGHRISRWAKNGTLQPASASIHMANTGSVACSFPARPYAIYLNGSTDYAEMEVYQNSGGTRTCNTGAPEGHIYMLVKYLGP